MGSLPDGHRIGLDRVAIAADTGPERDTISGMIRDRRPVHLVGAGGVGMAGLAVLLQGRGVPVSGCDRADNPWMIELRKRGLLMAKGHDPVHVQQGASWVVRSTAVADQHPEIQAACRLGLPVFHRGKVLAALCEGVHSIAISGTHGKTTTSSITASIFQRAGFDPGYCIGGQAPGLDFIAGHGSGPHLVIEADESDGTLAYYRPHAAVVTNIEFDHMEHFDTESDFAACLQRFGCQARQSLWYGADDPAACRLLGALPGARSFGIGDDKSLNCRAERVNIDPDKSSFELVFEGERLGRFHLGCPGLHNVQNALGAVAVSLGEGCNVHAAQEALADFKLPRRRFERITTARGVEVISDYAHHPTEIRALLDCARVRGARRILAVFQPHRYSRTAALLDAFPPAFEGADQVLLTPVYEASEDPIPGGTSEDLLAAFQRFGQTSTALAPGLEEAWRHLRSGLREGDLLLVVGAGDVDVIADWAKLNLEHDGLEGDEA